MILTREQEYKLTNLIIDGEEISFGEGYLIKKTDMDTRTGWRNSYYSICVDDIIGCIEANNRRMDIEAETYDGETYHTSGVFDEVVTKREFGIDYAISDVNIKIVGQPRPALSITK